MAEPLILVVDDNAPLRYALVRTLRQYDFQVIDAGSGNEGLLLADADQPDLILLDVNLPDIHGFDVARQLKASERTRHIPILQISASSVHAEHRVEGLAAGADAYLVEPVEPGELVANIRALLRMRDLETGLQRTGAMLAAVVDASPLAIVVFDRDGDVRSWNRAAERMFGYAADEVVGRDALAPAATMLALPTLVARIERGESIAGDEQTARRKDGTVLDLSVFAAPLPSRPTPGYVAIIEDISNRKRYERERSDWLAREREARHEAEAANRLKDEFLATLSHELRTPLNAIMGWASMLRQRTLDAAGIERALETIERNARSQEQLVSDILEVSRIIRGQLRLEMQRVDVVDAVRSAVHSVEPTAAAKALTLTIALPPEPVLVSGDLERLQQVFWNLLSNAVKYTPRAGRIGVTIDVDARDVVVRVTDSGIGITPAILPYVFDRFRQGDMKPTRDFGGLGLGLAIVRHLIEAHGGTVRAESPGTDQGSTFVVTLPAAA